MAEIEYRINGVDVSKIKNRNEKRLIQTIPEILESEYGDYLFEPLDIEDIYALALNILPARYVQKGTIILSEQLSKDDLKNSIREATDRVLDNPTRAGK
ncbi:Late competence development protein ComFB [Pseudodesulfovibrio profundus]|uniref:Late competence development protein ComFB n=1 Tax=Pseudodesulfovibrio profundus TaxID=57320 RepID=A0A2C8FCC6_9BACT|nr:late competence development ComFB family protein [Pseudodesulfovibrio profundus]MBC15601.1 competence protein ComFB [Desulfovibrio sp.]SOB59820.1 Late competence development protein ComFB [Pseudodesulfovibrio profundus]|tara:strand:- start:128 stop:424 length:297 start_codon:yes stop_codon:yes gene_type:complete